MALSKALNGATPAKMRGSAPNSGGMDRYRIANGFASDIFTGDIVKVSAGTVQPLATTTDRAVGVFMGCEYVDPTSKRPIWVLVGQHPPPQSMRLPTQMSQIIHLLFM